MSGEREVMFDQDNPEWTEEDFAHAKYGDDIPADVRAAFSGRGRPAMPESDRKQQVTLRLSPAVIAHFRATGKGWQTRIDEALKRSISS
jgi:uncharacterized protein (DUF4415 family)